MFYQPHHFCCDLRNADVQSCHISLIWGVNTGHCCHSYINTITITVPKCSVKQSLVYKLFLHFIEGIGQVVSDMPLVVVDTLYILIYIFQFKAFSVEPYHCDFRPIQVANITFAISTQVCRICPSLCCFELWNSFLRRHRTLNVVPNCVSGSTVCCLVLNPVPLVTNVPHHCSPLAELRKLSG